MAARGPYVAGQTGQASVGSRTIPPASPPAKRVSLPWLPFLPLLAIPFVGTSPESLDLIVVAMELIFLIMAIRDPLWAVGALALSEFTIRNYYLTLPVAGLIVLPHLIRGADLGPKARPMIITAGSLVVLAATTTFIAVGLNPMFTYSRSVVTDLFILILLPLVIKGRKDVLQIGLIALTIVATSAAVALAQQIGGARFLSVPHHTLVNVDLSDWGSRSLGLALNPILLSDYLMLLLFPVIGILLVRGVSHRASQVLMLLVLMMAAALLFSQTRSWVLSAAAATAAMAFVLRGRVGRELILILLIATFGFWYWADHSNARYGQGFGDDRSAAARLVLWSASLNVALDNPVLGVGYDQFLEFGPQYASSVDPDLLARFDAGERLGRDTPHNDYLNVWLSFGTGGLVLYLLLFAHTWANFHHAARTLQDPLLRGIALGSLGALVAFAVNSFFHNLFGSGATFWILAGLSVALAKLARAPEALESEARR